ncbi:MAG: TonB-dependent receptor [Thalassotalea sp.]
MFKLNKVSIALISSGVIAFSGSLAAQEAQAKKSAADEQVVEVIEVTGFRRSLIESLNQKRFSDTVSEQITADDLGGLPDVSMADALTRLPGVAAVRTGGQAAEINIRGMDGGFVASTLNGREQVSTGGSRSIEFDQYPSELISQAAVYKSPKASLIEGGVAGTVELKTASPLSIEQDHKFTVNARGMYNDRATEVHDAEEFGHRLSFSYQGKFLDETLGVAVGYARLYQPSVATQFIGLAYSDIKDVDGLANDTDGPVRDDDGDANRDIDKEFISEGFELQHLGGEETRNGYIAALEWAPNDTFKLRLDGFVSKFDSETFARGYRVKLGGTTGAYGNPIVRDNNVIGATVNRTSAGYTRIETVNDDNQDFDQVENYGLNLEWQLTDQLSANLDVSVSKAESNFRNGLLWSLVAEDATADVPMLDGNVSISYLLNGLDAPDVGFNQASQLTDVNNVMLSKYGIYPFENSDAMDAVRLDLKYDVIDNDYISSIEFGARYSDRTYSNQRSVFEYGDDGAFSTTEPPLQLTEDMTTVVDWQGEFSNFPSYLAIDYDKALAAWFPEGTPQPIRTWGTDSSGIMNESYAWTMHQSGEVYETVKSAYIMANIDSEFFGLPVTGNFGVRMVDTEQYATTLENVEGDTLAGAQYVVDEAGLVNDRYAPKLAGLEYTDYLPSLNLNFMISDNEQLRFAVAKVMARPDISRLAGDRSTDFDYTKDILTGSNNNNPYLKPFYADQFDISYERYFDETDGAFVAALFYKNIESFVQRVKIFDYNFAENGFYVPETMEDPDSGRLVQVDPVGEYETSFNNAEGGYIRGIELAYTEVFSYLPDLWSGLGMNISYSYTESEVSIKTDLSGTEREQTLPGLSANVLQATVFWGYDDFETRLSARYRDEFVSEQWGVNEQVVNFDAEVVMDFQASYNINKHLGVLLQVNNLTDEPTQSYFGSKEYTGTTQYFGRQVYFGANYTF